MLLNSSQRVYRGRPWRASHFPPPCSNGAAHADDAVKRVLMANGVLWRTGVSGRHGSHVSSAVPTLHRAFAVGMLPFFAFNYIYSPIGPRPMFHALPMAMDFGSNVAMCVVAALLGWQR